MSSPSPWPWRSSLLYTVWTAWHDMTWQRWAAELMGMPSSRPWRTPETFSTASTCTTANLRWVRQLTIATFTSQLKLPGGTNCPSVAVCFPTVCRRLDEMHFGVHITGCSVAVPASLLTVLSCGLSILLFYVVVTLLLFLALVGNGSSTNIELRY